MDNNYVYAEYGTKGIESDKIFIRLLTYTLLPKAADIQGNKIYVHTAIKAVEEIYTLVKKLEKQHGIK
jgi:hypothetical protein